MPFPNDSQLEGHTFADILGDGTKDHTSWMSDVGAAIDALNAGGGTSGLASATIAPGTASVVGDGVADDTAAIQTIFNSLPAGARCDVKRGTYKLTDQGAGFCVNIGTRTGIHVVGPSSGRGNPSGSGGSATFFTTSASTTIFKAEVASGINHYGPHFENLRIEDRGGSATCFSLLNYNNYNFEHVTFHGPGGVNTTVGLRLSGAAGDASYGHIEASAFHNCLLGLDTSTSVGVTVDGNTYFCSSTPNHVLLNMSGTAFCHITGNKFESNQAAGSRGIEVLGGVGAVDIVSNGFEGCTVGINLLGPVSDTYTNVSVVSNQFSGSGGTCTGWVCGTNRRRDTFAFNRYSNLTTNFTDNGTNTIIIGTRDDAARTNEFMRVGGKYFGAGTAAPPAISVPDGSMYYGNLSPFARANGAWFALKPAAAVSGLAVPSGRILGTIVAKQPAFAADGVTVVGWTPVWDAITGITSAQFLADISTNGSGLSNLIGPAGGLGYDIAAGETLIIAGGYQLSSASATVTCSDTKGNTYQVDRVDDRTTVGASAHSFILSARVTTPVLLGDLSPITVHFSTPVNNPSCAIFHYGGLATSAWVDQAVGATGSSTTPSSGAATTTQNNEMLFAAVYYNVQPAFTPGSGWATLHTTLNASTATLSSESRYQDIGTYTADSVLASSQPWAASLVTYKKA